MVWDEVPPRPRRRYNKGGGHNVIVNIPIDNPQATQPPPQPQQGENSSTHRLVPRPPSPQPSTSAQNTEMETEQETEENTPTYSEPSCHPHCISDGMNGTAHTQPIRGGREPKRGSTMDYKRLRSPENFYFFFFSFFFFTFTHLFISVQRVNISSASAVITKPSGTQ